MHSVCRRDSYMGYLALSGTYLRRMVDEVQRTAGLRSATCWALGPWYKTRLCRERSWHKAGGCGREDRVHPSRARRRVW
jgi:hypothetical protein